MSQWLYRIVPTRPAMVGAPTDAEAAVVDAHFAYLVGLRDRGSLILAGRTQESPSVGLVIYEAADETAARAVMQGDPAVAGGVFAASLHPYAVAVARGDLTS